MAEPSPLESQEEFTKNLPNEADMEGQISKRQRAWEWSSVEAGGFIFRKPLFESGKWRFRKVEKASGKAKRVTLKAGSLREARQEIAELVDKEKNAVREEGQIKAVALNTAFEEWIKAIDVNGATQAFYNKVGHLFRRFLGENKLVCEITYNDFESLFSNQWKKRKGRTKIAYRNIMRRFLSWCMKCSYAKNNIAEQIEIQKKWLQEQRDGMRYTAKAMSHDEAVKLLNACKDRGIITFPLKNTSRNRKEEIDYLWWFTFISLRTGLRVSNIIGSKFKTGLLWNDIDLDAKTISIDKSRMKNNMAFTIPIHEELLTALKQRLTSLGRIPNGSEQVIKIRELRGSFNSALKHAGLVHYRIHDLRHSFASWIGAYCPYAIMKKLLGHCGGTVTDKYILHQDVETMRKELNKLPWLTQVTAVQGQGAEVSP